MLTKQKSVHHLDVWHLHPMHMTSLMHLPIIIPARDGGWGYLGLIQLRHDSGSNLACGLDIYRPRNTIVSRYLSKGTSSVSCYTLVRRGPLTVGMRWRLDSLLTTLFRRILGYCWQDRLTNVRVSGIVRISSVPDLWSSIVLRWAYALSPLPRPVVRPKALLGTCEGIEYNYRPCISCCHALILSGIDGSAHHCLWSSNICKALQASQWLIRALY